jgi:hypothetical protein
MYTLELFQKTRRSKSNHCNDFEEDRATKFSLAKVTSKQAREHAKKYSNDEIFSLLE